MISVLVQVSDTSNKKKGKLIWNKLVKYWSNYNRYECIHTNETADPPICTLIRGKVEQERHNTTNNISRNYFKYIHSVFLSNWTQFPSNDNLSNLKRHFPGSLAVGVDNEALTVASRKYL
jgi:hypothetical protein